MDPVHTVHTKRGWKQFELHAEEISHYPLSVVSLRCEHGRNEYRGELTVQKSAMVLMD